MRFIAWNLALAAFLLVSAFALAHSEVSMAVTFVAGVAVGVLALAAGGRPGLRYGITAIALVLGGVALFAVDASGAARVATALAAAVLFALSSISPRHASRGEAPAAPGA